MQLIAKANMNYKQSACLLFVINHLIFSLTNGLTKPNPQNKIVKGREAKPGEFPYIVALRTDDAADKLFCAGNLIHPRWVLTVKHCVEGIEKFKKKWIMTMNTDNKRAIGNKTKFYLEKYVEVGKGNPPLHDAVLIRLTKPVNISGIHPIVLAHQHKFSIAGAPAVAAGWGVYDSPRVGLDPPTLRTAGVTVLPPKVCEERYPPTFDALKFICAGTRNGSICFGDSGGPLLLKATHSHKDLLIGLTTLANLLCWIPQEAIFSRVHKVKSRIRKILKTYGDEIV